MWSTGWCMQNKPSINILIAEDNDISREMMTVLLRTRGYNIIGVTDGQKAIDAVRLDNIDLALVDINMEPKGGFPFVEHLVAQGKDIPVVIVTGDNSSDVLMKASALGVTQVIHKPLEPKRLIGTVRRILKRRGINPDPLAVSRHDYELSPHALMRRAIEIAEQNAQSGKGRAFGAVVADEKGHIIGEGINGVSSRVDPSAHAEVMAIRQAAEYLERADLSDCTLYVTSEPTMMGKALIISVGIEHVYFGLSHDDIKGVKSDSVQRETKVRQSIIEFTHPEVKYEQIMSDDAKAMFKKSIT